MAIKTIYKIVLKKKKKKKKKSFKLKYLKALKENTINIQKL